MPTAERLAPNAKTSLCLFAVIIGMGLLQTFARPTGAGREKPGPSRGDLVLNEDALPAELAGWTRTKFIPAPPVEELPEGQFWWVHQWQYQKDRTTALVSFDQLGETNWHELTYCYTGLGWTIDSREVLQHSDTGGTYAVAKMKMESGEQAILVFSVFFEDGLWATAPGVDLPRLNARGDDYLSKVGDRLRPIISFAASDSSHKRALQCQVFVPGLREISPSLIASSVELHRESRERFRSSWLGHSVLSTHINR